MLAILMRHGKTALNDPKKPRVRGWVDAPLSDEGKLEVQQTANRIRFYKPEYIFHSDFMRDSETAHIVANKLNIPVETDFDSRTWDVGSFSGKLESEVNDAILDLYRRPWETPPGSSESFNQFASRFTRFLDNKLDFATADVYRPVLIVTHGRNIALAQAYLEGINEWDAYMPMPAGIAVIRVNPDKTLSIEIEDPKEPVIADV